MDPRWTHLAQVDGFDVYEDFTTLTGAIAFVRPDGATIELGKSAEPLWWDPETAELPPIATMAVHSFVGMPDHPDKVGVTARGVTANLDPAQLRPAALAPDLPERAMDGLVGGWLPVLRWVYPGDDGGWTELMLFAPPGPGSGNARIQPVWYRVVRVAGGRPVAIDYVDSYLPSRSEPGGFYRDLLATRSYWEGELAPAMTVELPDRRLADQARHSLARARMTRVGDWPKYGVLDRNYGGAEHDGFQDTFTVDMAAALDWGLSGVARRYLVNYFENFVRDDGSLVYRGPGTGQYGRMLTVVARYFQVTVDFGALLAYRRRIDAVARLLLNRPREQGIIVGWCEADSSLEADPGRYLLPYLSNSAEAVRGWHELGTVWQSVGALTGDDALAAWGAELRAESAAMRGTLQEVVRRSLRYDCAPPWLPVIAGVTTPFHEAVPADDHDPQFRAYRANAELLHSGTLTADQVRVIVDYRAAHGDIVLGVPAAYAYSRDPGLLDGNREMAGFLSYGHGYGLLHHGFVAEFRLLLDSLSRHQYTPGTWTAPETRRVRPGSPAAAYCAPAQLAVPLLLRWALVFEEPDADVLWLAKGCPPEWFAEDAVIAVSGAPTRWGPVGFRIAGSAATVDAPPGVQIRLRGVTFPPSSDRRELVAFV